MNKKLLHITLSFLGLLILQIFVMDQVQFMGYICPLVYMLFIVFYPIKNNRLLFLIIGFLLGITVDFFQDTGGAHAAAAVTLVYTRPLLLKLVYGISYRTKNLKIYKLALNRFLLLLALSITVHHLVLYLLIYFNILQFLQVLKMTFAIGLSTFFIGFIIFMLVVSRNQR